jgi:hypothetical protein
LGCCFHFYYSDVKALEIETPAALDHKLYVDPQTWIDWLIEVRSLATAAEDFEAVEELLAAVAPEDPAAGDDAAHWHFLERTFSEFDSGHK